MIYQILPSTSVRVKRVETDWIGANIESHLTKRLNQFTDSDLLLDPYAVFNPVPNNLEARIKIRWAECGCYGFKRDDWIVLVDKKLVMRRESC